MRKRLSTSAPVLLLPSPIEKKTSMSMASTANTGAIMANAQSLGLPITSAPSLSTSEVTSKEFGTPSLDSATYNEDGYLEVNFVAKVNGFACCVYQINDDTVLSASQIYDGKNENQEDISDNQYCVDTVSRKNATIALNFTEIGVEGNYTGSCTACNNYPILPLCIDGDDILTFTVERLNITSFAHLAQAILTLVLTQMF